MEASVNDQRPVAVITGGASGIGLAAAEAFVARGYDVVLADLDGDRASDEAKRLGRGDVRALGVPLDVGDSASIAATVDRVREQLGRTDVLVNSAGYADSGPSEQISDDVWDRMIRVHLGGTFRCSRGFFELLRDAPAGSIVNLSSIGAHVGRPGRPHYGAAKSGIEGMTRTLSVEWASHGIRVNAVAPGHVHTPLIDTIMAAGTFNPERTIARIPLSRLGRPEEIAAAIVFLGSTDGSFVTGQVLVADGGMTVNGSFE